MYMMQIVERPFKWGGVENVVEENLFIRLARSGLVRTVFDIGARNTNMPYIFDRDCSIYLFEPNPIRYRDLMDEFKVYNNVYVNGYGVGDVNGTIPYYENTESFIERKVHVQSRNPIMLPIKSFQTVVSELDLPSIDFMKIDTEGGEYSILKSAQSYILDKKIKFIQFEIGGTIFDIKENLYDIFDLFGEDWRIFNMEGNCLNRMRSAFTWDPSCYGNSNLLATWIPDNELIAFL